MANYLGQPLNLQTARTQARNPINQTVNTGNTVGNTINGLLQGAKGAEFLANRGTRDTLNEQQVASNEQKLDANAQKLEVAKDTQLRTSLATGAQEFINAYNSGGPDAGYAALVQRKEKLAAEGKSTAETDAAIAAFQQNPEQFAKQSQGTIENAYEQGILKQPKLASGSTSTAHAKNWYLYKNTPEGPEKEQLGMMLGITPKVKTQVVKTAEGYNVINALNGEVISSHVDPATALQSAEKTKQAQLKTEAAETKKLENKAKVINETTAKVDAARGIYATGNDTLNTVDELLNHPGRTGATGMKDASSLYGVIPKPIPGTEEADFVAKLETLDAQTFLIAVKDFKEAGGAGGLSNDEGKRLSAAIQSLSRDQSDAAIKKNLLIVKEIVQRQLNNAEKSYKSSTGKLFKIDETASEVPEYGDIRYGLKTLDDTPTMGYGNSAPPAQRDSYIRNNDDAAPVRSDESIGQPTPTNSAPKVGRFIVEEE